MRRAYMAMMIKAVAHRGNATGSHSASSRRTLGPLNSHQRGCTVIHGILLIISLLTLVAPGSLWAAGTRELGADKSISTEGLLNFDALVRIALHQSPYFTKSGLEIEVKRMDESDSRWGLIPPLTFRSIYYLNAPPHTNLSHPYSLSFSTDPYNPVGSYLSLQAHKIATQMTIYSHLAVISNGIERVGKIFLQINGLKQTAKLQDDIVSLARENQIYVENRFSIGTASSLEVQMATQELELARGEKERLAATYRRSMENLKSFLGIKTNQDLNLDLRDATRQVLGSFEPEKASLDQATARSYDLKVLELKKKLQGYNVGLAKVKAFPTFQFSTQTPDPLSVTSAQGMYAGVGIEVPVWDGFKRIRDISRQKTILQQFGAEKETKEMSLSNKWWLAKSDATDAVIDRKIAQEGEKLARLKERQSEISYQSGEVSLPLVLENRKKTLEALKVVTMKTTKYYSAVLELRELSGDLGQSYVDPGSYEK